jgi:RES domain-containing protein
VIAAWRLIKARLANQAFTGEGARLFGGRWNSPGIPLIYTSATASLAVLEIFANVQRSELLGAYMLMSCGFDAALVTHVSPQVLPKNWRHSPPPPELREIGDGWVIREESAVLAVPSSIIETELNYLINPRHVDFQKVERSEPEPFRFNLRLVK